MTGKTGTELLEPASLSTDFGHPPFGGPKGRVDRVPAPNVGGQEQSVARLGVLGRSRVSRLLVAVIAGGGGRVGRLLNATLRTASIEVGELLGALHRGDALSVNHHAVMVERAVQPLLRHGYTFAAVLAARLRVNLRAVQHRQDLAELRSRLEQMHRHRSLCPTARRCLDAVDKALAAECALRTVQDARRQILLLIERSGGGSSGVAREVAIGLWSALFEAARNVLRAYGVEAVASSYGSARCERCLIKDAIAWLLWTDELDADSIRGTICHLPGRELQELRQSGNYRMDEEVAEATAKLNALLDSEISARGADVRNGFLAGARKLLEYEMVVDTRGALGEFGSFLQSVAETARCLRAFDNHADIHGEPDGDVGVVRKALAAHLGAQMSWPLLSGLGYASLIALRELPFEGLGVVAGIDRVQAEIGQRQRVAAAAKAALADAAQEAGWAVLAGNSLKDSLTGLLRVATLIDARASNAAKSSEFIGQRLDREKMVALMAVAVGTLDSPAAEKLTGIWHDAQVRAMVSSLLDIGGQLSQIDGATGDEEHAEIGRRMVAAAASLKMLGQAVCRASDIPADDYKPNLAGLSPVCNEVLTSYFRIVVRGNGGVNVLDGKVGPNFQRHINAWLKGVCGPVEKLPFLANAFTALRDEFESGRTQYSIDVGERASSGTHLHRGEWMIAEKRIRQLAANDDEIVALVARVADGGWFAAIESGLGTAMSPICLPDGTVGRLSDGRQYSYCRLYGDGCMGVVVELQYCVEKAERFVIAATGTSVAVDSSISRCILTTKVYLGKNLVASLIEPVRYSYDLKVVERDKKVVAKSATSLWQKSRDATSVSVARQALVTALDLLASNWRGQMNRRTVGSVAGNSRRERARYLENLLKSDELQLSSLGREELLDLHRALKTLRFHHGFGLVQSEIERRNDA